MRAIKPGGTREQQAVGDWLDAAALVRGRLDPIDPPSAPVT